MEYKCNTCDKKYVSYKSLWNHNKKFHTIKNVQNVAPNVVQCPENVSNVVHDVAVNIQQENKICKKCNKTFCDRIYRWRHEKKCNEVKNQKSEIELMKKQIEDIKQESKKEMESLKNQLQKALKIHPKTLQKINKQLNNNGTINNNTINIIQLGKEDLSKMLSTDEKMKILNRQAMGINDLVKLVHTSGKYKKCMNVYITNLQNTIGYMYDEKQNTFIAVNKNELLNDLLDSRMYDIENFYEKLQLKFEPEKANKIKKFIDRMKNDEDCLKDLKKEEIKLILYNNREIISTILPKIENKNIEL